jgi:hypothetical protein
MTVQRPLICLLLHTLLLHHSLTSRPACQLKGPGSISLNSLNSGSGGFHVMSSWHKMHEANVCKGGRFHSSVRFTCSTSETKELIRITFVIGDSTLKDFCEYNYGFYRSNKSLLYTNLKSNFAEFLNHRLRHKNLVYDKIYSSD